MLFRTTRERRCSSSGSPVFGFTSKRGEFLLEMSTRMGCPRRNTSEVGYISIVNSQGFPGSRAFPVLSDSQ